MQARHPLRCADAQACFVYMAGSLWAMRHTHATGHDARLHSRPRWGCLPAQPARHRPRQGWRRWGLPAPCPPGAATHTLCTTQL